MVQVVVHDDAKGTIGMPPNLAAPSRGDHSGLGHASRVLRHRRTAALSAYRRAVTIELSGECPVTGLANFRLWHSRGIQSAPAERLLTEAVLKDVCVMPNRRP